MHSAGPGESPKAETPRLRGSLFRRYALYLTLLFSLALLISGGTGFYFAYRNTRALVNELQLEKAKRAAASIGQFIKVVELQVRGATLTEYFTEPSSFEARHIELVKLLRIAPSISNAVWVDSGGYENIRVSRLARDIIGANANRSSDSAVIGARNSKTWYGGITFRLQSEPHLTMAVAGNHSSDGVAIVDINLKFASDVISGIRIGSRGKAYVVDGKGTLIIHPDAAMMLQRANLAQLPQVRAAISSTDNTSRVQTTSIARMNDGGWTIAASAPINPPGWHVIVEQPVAEAFAPLFESLTRTGVLMLAGTLLAVAASIAMARRMTWPIRMLENGAQRIGEGKLEERVEIDTGDELQSLAEQFNRMAGKLQESYTDLERKVEDRTRQLEDANRDKVRFLAAASHDLRQPVHALGLFVAQLQETRDETARRHLIGKVAASSEAISDLIESLLDISKLDAGTVTPRPTAFALQPLFDRIEQAFSFAAREKGLRLRIRPTKLRVRTDPVLLERILLNLCANAVRYTSQGGAILGARTRCSVVRIEVWDTGIGIAADQQRHIFEEFYQAAGAPDSPSKGLGLGLAIVDRLSKLLELQIRFRSMPGRGSVFAIDVPAATSAEESDATLSPPLSSVRLDELPVLLIDDDPVARDATAGLLAQWGCAVRSADSGAKAMRLVSEGIPPRLIICDYRLGNNELGTEVIRELRGMVPESTSAVIISADATEELRQATALAGLHLLHKPLNAARLRALLLHIAAMPPAVRQA